MGAKPPRISLDANVLLSAAYDPESRSTVLLGLGRLGRATFLSSPYAVEEARRNLQLKRPAVLSQFKELLRSVGVVREAPVETVRQVAVQYGVHAADAPILAAALTSRADILKRLYP